MAEKTGSWRAGIRPSPMQVTASETLQNNLSTVDFSLLLVDVMSIADEVDSQLKQTITSFMGQAAQRTAA
jgi:hypothetical protein